MSDFRADGYTLLQDNLMEGKLPAASAWNIGRSLAQLQHALADHALMRGIRPVENSTIQIRERLAEAHILLYGNLDRYLQLEAKLLEDDNLLYTDGHPKNIAVNDAGDVILFDFGRIIRGCNQYPAANFAAHIGLAWLGGTLPSVQAQAFIEQVYEAYNNYISLEEQWFVRFFAAELVHRGLALRWIDPRMFQGNRKLSARLAVHAVFLDVFENGAESLKELFLSLKKRDGMPL